MGTYAKRLLFWTPRILTLLFAVFLGLFATDVFNEGYGFWDTVKAFLIHLIPAFSVLVVLALAWRWAWIGALVFTSFATIYTIGALDSPHPVAWPLIIAGPQLVIALLFLFNWINRKQLRGRQPPQPVRSP